MGVGVMVAVVAGWVCSALTPVSVIVAALAVAVPASDVAVGWAVSGAWAVMDCWGVAVSA